MSERGRDKECVYEPESVGRDSVSERECVNERGKSV